MIDQLTDEQRNVLLAVWPENEDGKRELNADALRNRIPNNVQVLTPHNPTHPLLPAPGPVMIVRNLWDAHGRFSRDGLARYNEALGVRNKSILNEERDPFRNGWEPPNWKLCDVLVGIITPQQFYNDKSVPDAWKAAFKLNGALLRKYLFIQILGGNRSGKTEWACKRIVYFLYHRRNANIWLLHQNIDQSIEWHHTTIYKYLPPEWKTLPIGRGDNDAYISYRKKTGFSGMKLVAPTGSTLSFKTYQQYEDDEYGFEGGELGSPDRAPCLGYVGDENMPLALYNTLRRAQATRGSVGVQPFTPIKGYDEVVGQTLEGAKDVYTEWADDLPVPKDVPLMQTDADGKSAMVYFWSKLNPYGNYPALRELYGSEPDKVQTVRFYGVPYKAKDTPFPKYNEKIHLFDIEDMPSAVTRYMVMDPSGLNRNSFMLWCAVDVYGRIWVYREWPCPNIAVPTVGYPGPWAVSGKSKGHAFGGLPGDGCEDFGFDLLDYKSEIARLEGWDDVGRDIPVEDWDDRNGADERMFGRDIDSRFANTQRATGRGNTTLTEEYGSIKVHFTPTSSAGMTEGRMPIVEGVKLINDGFKYTDGWLEATRAGKPARVEDGPSIFINRECDNLRFALKAFTGLGGQKEATKDPIDCLRYLVLKPVIYIDEALLRQRSRRSGSRSYGGSMPRNEFPAEAVGNKRQRLLSKRPTRRRL
ncbi:MAG: hypothetical protein AAFX93_19865 [Verrucomicrobiota bacterium]